MLASDESTRHAKAINSIFILPTKIRTVDNHLDQFSTLQCGKSIINRSTYLLSFRIPISVEVSRSSLDYSEFRRFSCRRSKADILENNLKARRPIFLFKFIHDLQRSNPRKALHWSSNFILIGYRWNSENFGAIRDECLEESAVWYRNNNLCSL